MDQTFGVRGSEGRSDLPDNCDCLPLRQRPYFLDQSSQITTFDQAHSEEESAIDLTEIIDRNNMGFVELGDDLRFSPESVLKVGVIGKVDWKPF